jgi:hypothetical protein
MTRLRGIEEEAKRKGFACEFLTLTCPSRMHPTKTVNAKTGYRIQNPKYDGTTPKEAQQYLVKVWARIRAEFKRKDINPVGFRITEPHGDACPHWHILLYIEPKKRIDMWQIAQDHASREDSHELTSWQAKKARFDREFIDMHKGSGVAYVAKYISKNVSMDGLEDFESHEGGSAAEGVERVTAWARVWGIRQFQQQGGERVTVWRELRRIRQGQDLPDWVKPLWKAADAGEYAVFLREALKRRISLIRENEKQCPIYERVWQPDEKGFFGSETYKETGKQSRGIFNKYGEPAAGAIKGLLVDGLEVITRIWQWTFSYKEPPKPKVRANHKRMYIDTGAVLTALSDKAKAFNSFLWELAAPKRKGLEGYPRPSKIKLEPAKLAKLGLV